MQRLHNQRLQPYQRIIVIFLRAPGEAFCSGSERRVLADKPATAAHTNLTRKRGARIAILSKAESLAGASGWCAGTANG